MLDLLCRNEFSLPELRWKHNAVGRNATTIFWRLVAYKYEWPFEHTASGPDAFYGPNAMSERAVWCRRVEGSDQLLQPLCRVLPSAVAYVNMEFVAYEERNFEIKIIPQYSRSCITWHVNGQWMVDFIGQVVDRILIWRNNLGRR